MKTVNQNGNALRFKFLWGDESMQPGYEMIPRALKWYVRPVVGLAEYSVLEYLVEHYCRNADAKQQITLATSVIAHDLGIEERQLRRYMERLEQFGLVRRVTKPGNLACYDLTATIDLVKKLSKAHAAGDVDAIRTIQQGLVRANHDATMRKKDLAYMRKRAKVLPAPDVDPSDPALFNLAPMSKKDPTLDVDRRDFYRMEEYAQAYNDESARILAEVKKRHPGTELEDSLLPPEEEVAAALKHWEGIGVDQVEFAKQRARKAATDLAFKAIERHRQLQIDTERAERRASAGYEPLFEKETLELSIPEIDEGQR